MRQFGFAAVAAAWFTLTSCASAPTDLSFQPDGGEALMIMAAPADSSNYVHIFRRVDRETGQFVGNAIQFHLYNGGLYDAPPNQLNLDSQHRPVALAYKRFPPGDYALVEVFQAMPSEHPAYYGPTRRGCLNNASPIFSIRPGVISVVRTDVIYPTPAPNDSAVMAELQRARNNYPGIQGEAVLVEPAAWAQWPERRPSVLASRQCAEPDGFSLRDAR